MSDEASDEALLYKETQDYMQSTPYSWKPLHEVLDAAKQELEAILNGNAIQYGSNKLLLLEGWAIKWFNFEYTGVFDPQIYGVRLRMLERFLKEEEAKGSRKV